MAAAPEPPVELEHYGPIWDPRLQALGEIWTSLQVMKAADRRRDRIARRDVTYERIAKARADLLREFGSEWKLRKADRELSCEWKLPEDDLVREAYARLDEALALLRRSTELVLERLGR